MTTSRQFLDAAMRKNLVPFVHRSFLSIVPGESFLVNWHIEAICHELEKVQRGECKRLLITIPPRHLKSICSSVAFAAWVLGMNPKERVICVSYSAELARNLAEKCRAIMQSTWYQRLFPGTRLKGSRPAEMDFMTTERGGRFSTSIGGTLTGRGGDLIIIDDPLKPEDANSEAKRKAANEWFSSTLYSRLDNKKTGRMVVIMQRLHTDDLAAKLLDSGEWNHLNLPAIAEEDQKVEIGSRRTHYRKAGEILHPKRESQAELDAIHHNMGSASFSAQYQQRPVPAAGNLIKRDWLRYYSAIPDQPSGRPQVVQSWDTAVKEGRDNDYSVCLTFKVIGNQYYLIDVLRMKLNYPDLRRKIVHHAGVHRADTVLIEDAASGSSIVQDLRNDPDTNVVKPIGVTPGGSKLERAAIQSPKIEGGQLFLPEKASWLDDFIHELLSFPSVKHDDQVDALTQFLQWQSERRIDLLPRGGPMQGEIFFGYKYP